MIRVGVTWLEIGIRNGLAYATAAIGLYFLFVKLGFPDLTFDGSFALGAGVSATSVVLGLSPIGGLLLGAGAGICTGAMTSFLYLRLGLNKLICGIIVTAAAYTINLRVMRGSSVSLLRHDTLFERPEAAWIVPLTLTLIVIAVGTWTMRSTLGIALRALGDNETRVQELGLPHARLTLIGLIGGNLLVSVCGALVAQRQGFAAADMGVGAIIWGLAAILIGSPLSRRLKRWDLVGPAVGMILYSVAVSFGLRLGLPATDLRLATALLVVIALYLSQGALLPSRGVDSLRLPPL